MKAKLSRILSVLLCCCCSCLSLADGYSHPERSTGAENEESRMRYSSEPVLIDQFIDGFFARGMLTGETNDVITEVSLLVPAEAGATFLDLASVKGLVVGGGITIQHENGTYWPYLIRSISGSTVNLFPPLRSPVSISNKAERTWYNRAHPGKFYMRYLAQRIASGKERDNAFPRGKRVAFIEYGSGTTAQLGGLTVTPGATVNYYAASPTGSSGTVSTPPRFTFEKTAYVEFDANAAGSASTGQYATRGYSGVAAIITMANDCPIRIAIMDQSGKALAYKVIPPSTGAQRRHRLNFFTGSSASVSFRFEAATPALTAMSLASIEAFEQPPEHGLIVAKRDAVIVGLGDSWIAGDEAVNPERESILTQLAIELPAATIINAGVGGNLVWEQIARFDTDVAPHNPDYVIVNTGTNEAYNPGSVNFDPTAVDFFIGSYVQLIGKIQSIGARPILLGPPALAQSDGEVSGLPEWELLNRSKLHYIRLMRALSDRPNAS